MGREPTPPTPRLSRLKGLAGAGGTRRACAEGAGLLLRVSPCRPPAAWGRGWEECTPPDKAAAPWHPENQGGVVLAAPPCPLLAAGVQALGERPRQPVAVQGRGQPLSREPGVGSPSPWAHSVGVAEKGDFFFFKEKLCT